MNQETSRGEVFRQLHARTGLFAIPNPWDAGSAKILAALGFEALATTSAGFAYSVGKPDGEGALDRDETLANAKSIVDATPLPVSADLENGFGDTPEACARTITMAAGIGLAGGSIEDATGRDTDPIYPFALALERVSAAVQAARTLPSPFVLTARAENLIHGRLDLPDTIRRLEAFAAAGADVLYAPGLKRIEDIATVVRAVAPKPVNVVMGLSGPSFSLDQLAAVGVKRVSLGSSLARAAYSAFLHAAREIRETGTFDFAAQTTPYAEFNALFKRAGDAR
ncbi:MAG: isocitrate lyase/phosphoenolpyruvate mutase family protein [Betaproteobacteria bacterium]